MVEMCLLRLTRLRLWVRKGWLEGKQSMYLDSEYEVLNELPGFQVPVVSLLTCD